MLPSDHNSTHFFDPPMIDGQFASINVEAGIPSVVPTPTVVAGYHVERELGRGGMGVVYLATQDGLNRQVALKMVLSGEHASATEKGRFLAEAEAVAAVRHPGVVQVFDFGTHDGRPYFALEYLPGGSLAAKLNGTPLPVPEAVKLMGAICRAVQAAHDAGVIHRDLKPSNILYDTDGTPKVTDFGLARKADTQSGLTATGAVLGTPSYMSPEQAEGRKDLGTAADVYALGAVLYECLSGRPPFRAASPLETVLQVMKDEPVPPSRFTPKLPRDLETICLKCLSKDPRKRYPSAGAMADDLQRFCDGEPILARPVSSAERGWRWVRRNPALAAAVVGGPTLLAGTTIIVLIALLMTTRANVRLDAERQNAENQKKEAEIHQADAEKQRGLAHARLQKAVEAVDKMILRVSSERWATNPTLQEERRQVLEEAVAFFNSFTAEESTDPLVRREAAKAYARVAGAYLMLGDLTKVSAAAREAVRLYGGLATDFPDEPDYLTAASEVYSVLGGANTLNGRYADALPACLRAVDLADLACAKMPGWVNAKFRAVEARSSLAYFLFRADRSKGQEVLNTMLELARDLGSAPGALYEHRVALAFALSVAAVYDLPNTTAAGEKYDEAAKLLDGVKGEKAPSARAWEQFAHTRAIVTTQKGFIILSDCSIKRPKKPEQLREAVEIILRGVQMYDELLKANPLAFPYRLQKCNTFKSLAMYLYENDRTQAEKHNDEAIRLEIELNRDFPHVPWIRGNEAYRQAFLIIDRIRDGETVSFEEEVTKYIADANPEDAGNVKYNVVCAYSIASEKRREDAEKYAARAVVLLTELAKTDYFRVRARREHLDVDPDLDPLRKRDDFIAFLAAVKKANAIQPKTK